MTTHSIGGGGALCPLVPATAPPPSDEGGEGQFASLLAGLGEMQGEADAALADLSIGGDRDLHDVVLAVGDGVDSVRARRADSQPAGGGVPENLPHERLAHAVYASNRPSGRMTEQASRRGADMP